MMKNLNTIKEIAKKIRNETLILFWQFTIKTLDELDIVSNQNFSIEMFLIRLIYLKEISNTSEIIDQKDVLNETKINNEDSSINMKSSSNENNDLFDLKKKTIDQIKNVVQEKHPEHETKKEEQQQVKNL